MLIIDEADAILKIGFEEEMNKIIKLLPQNSRTTCLFSATMTKKVEDLCRLSLKNPVLVEVAKDSNAATVANLEQGYVLVLVSHVRPVEDHAALELPPFVTLIQLADFLDQDGEARQK